MTHEGSRVIAVGWDVPDCAVVLVPALFTTAAAGVASWRYHAVCARDRREDESAFAATLAAVRAHSGEWSTRHRPVRSHRRPPGRLAGWFATAAALLSRHRRPVAGAAEHPAQGRHAVDMSATCVLPAVVSAPVPVRHTGSAPVPVDALTAALRMVPELRRHAAGRATETTVELGAVPAETEGRRWPS
jgi:hypothetical protein